MRSFTKEHPLAAFFVLAFGIAWLWEVLAFGLLDLPEGAILVGAFAPPAAAVVVTRAVDGGAGARAFLRRILLWRVDWRWYAFVLGALPAVAVLSFVFLEDGTENLPSVPRLVPSYLLAVVILAFLGGGQEEPGWRGFALPRLQARFGPLDASVLLGAVWGLWHLPLYVLVDDYNNAGSGLAEISTSFIGFCGYTVAFAVILTWLMNHTSPSLLLVMLLHGAMNTVFGMAPERTAASWAVTGAVAAVAVVLVVATRGRLGEGAVEDAPRVAAVRWPHPA